MNKKGAELSMNVIIIAILGIIVLVIIAAFFMGGFSKLYDGIRNVFSGTVPDDQSTAISNCENNCKFAQLMDSANAKASSLYCKGTAKYDSDGDGQVDEKHHCWSSWIGVDCPGVRDFCTASDIEKL